MGRCLFKPGQQVYFNVAKKGKAVWKKAVNLQNVQKGKRKWPLKILETGGHTESLSSNIITVSKFRKVN